MHFLHSCRPWQSKVETKVNDVVTKTEYRHYIGDVAVVTKEEASSQTEWKIGFTHRDRLGSVVTVTDGLGDVQEHRSYDPFGKPRKGDFKTPSSSTLLASIQEDPHSGSELITNRGFTDHEHLDDFELIHMNGRAYDYNLGRFLSVDPFIQAPGNSQSMNPYSYIMNNPLAGTDPSGYLCESDQSGAACDFAKSDIEKYVVYKDAQGNDFTVAIANNGDTFKVEGLSMSNNGNGGLSFGDVGSRITTEELGAIQENNAPTVVQVLGIVGDTWAETARQSDIDVFGQDLGAGVADFMDYKGIDRDIRQSIEDLKNGNVLMAALGFACAAKCDKLIPDALKERIKKFFRGSDGDGQGTGYGPNDPPVRIEGDWSINDMKQALLGHPPRGLGSPDLHHADQMPGSAIHEILPLEHRGNRTLHPNKFNQGVTKEMRDSDRKLHWWYRAREQGADRILPDWIYDK